jgi:hypothetical protein
MFSTRVIAADLETSFLDIGDAEEPYNLRLAWKGIEGQGGHGTVNRLDLRNFVLGKVSLLEVNRSPGEARASLDGLDSRAYLCLSGGKSLAIAFEKPKLEDAMILVERFSDITRFAGFAPALNDENLVLEFSQYRKRDGRIDYKLTPSTIGLLRNDPNSFDLRQFLTQIQSSDAFEPKTDGARRMVFRREGIDVLIDYSDLSANELKHRAIFSYGRMLRAVAHTIRGAV